MTKFKIYMTLEDAAKMACWLIETRNIKPFSKAYIISAKKYKIKNWHEVQKFYNKNLKMKQLDLL